MPAPLLRVNSDKPNPQEIQVAVNCLRDGGVIIYPTDTVYGIGCDITKKRAVERIAKLKGIAAEDAKFAMIFYDLSHLADYTKPIENRFFRTMKSALPGAFTFILEANNSVPKIFNKQKKKEVGIRVPDHAVPREIVRVLGNPIVTTSLHDSDELVDYTTDPQLIYENFKDQVDLIIDGGYGNNIPSTIVNCTSGDFEVIRQGLGDLNEYL